MLGRWWWEREGEGEVGKRVARLLGTVMAVAVVGSLLPPGILPAQELPAPDIGLVGGSFSYDLGVRGDATSPFGGLRVRFPLSRYVLVEPALTFTRLTADSVDSGADRDINLLVMEFQAQVQYPLDRVRPYLGMGAGGVLDLRGERGTDDFVVSTYSLSAGLAVDLGSSWAIRGELRGRAIDHDENSALELGLGLSTTF